MRWFSNENQRSIGQCNSLSIYPAREIVYSRKDTNEIARRIEKELNLTLDSVSSEIKPLLKKNIMRYVDKLHDSHYFTGVDKFTPYLINEKASLFDYLKERHIVFFEEPEKIRERMENEQQSLNNLCETLIEKGMILKGTFSMLFDMSTLIGKAEKNSIITLAPFEDSSPLTSHEAVNVRVQGSSISPYNGKLDILSADVKKWVAQGLRIQMLS